MHAAAVEGTAAKGPLHHRHAPATHVRLHALEVATIRAVRGAMPLGDHPETLASFVETASPMRLDQFLAISFATLDGTRCAAADLVSGRTVLILIDAHRARAERSAAEVAWVVERLAPETGLVVVWPRGTSHQATHIPKLPMLRMVEDVTGAFRRLVSPTGKRVAVLVDLAIDSLSPLTAESPLFDVGHGAGGTAGRGTDRTVDLGDMHL